MRYYININSRSIRVYFIFHRLFDASSLQFHRGVFFVSCDTELSLNSPACTNRVQGLVLKK